MFTALAHRRFQPPYHLILLTLTIALAGSPVCGRAEPLSATTAEDLRTRIQTVEDRLLILTPAALYRFQPVAEAWTVTTGAEGLPGTPLTNLSITGGNIWVTGDGASVSDVRFDDWQRYGAGEGYPGRFLFAVEADEDYAYAGTDEGAARFDQYILEWETLPDPVEAPLGSVVDVAVGDEFVWFALDGGVAEYRKDVESFRLFTTLGQLQAPRVLALRQTARFLWAVTDAGIARYDKDLQTWTSFPAGVDLPDTRIHQVTLWGDDLWLGTDTGLWHYLADSSIWRRDESNDEMPGQQVLAFALASQQIWVVTERAFAVYDEDSARWVDFSPAVPLSPDAVVEMVWTGDTLLFNGRDQIVYGLRAGRNNPNLFLYRSRATLTAAELALPERGPGWSLGLNESGLNLGTPTGANLNLKGGVTVFVEDDDSGPAGDTGLGNLVSDSRLDLSLSGRLGNDRTLSGFYNTTDPDNRAYQLTYRGARLDFLRVASVGEIEQQLYNSRLSPGTGLRGGWIRAEAGGRSEQARRRLLTADAWAGERRTLPGRDVFFGGNRTVSGSTRDVDFLRNLVFPTPQGWTADDLRGATIYQDDGLAVTDDANTELRILAGRDGAWDRLQPNSDYVLGPGARTVILVSPLGASGALVAVRGGEQPSPAGEVNLTDLWLRNHYWVAADPVPGSLRLAIVDSTGSRTDGTGTSYLEVFGLDGNGDGWLDPERFSPITGLVSFRDTLPFPPEVYEDTPTSSFNLEYSYQASLNTFQLSHRDLVPGSEQIRVDRVLLRTDVDYSLIPSSGLFVLFEHVLLDEDTVIEVDYQFEVGERFSSVDEADRMVVAGQLGLAPNDHLFGGVNATQWHDEEDRSVTTTNMNARLEWKDDDRFLRLTPEMAWSQASPAETSSGSEGRERQGIGSGVGLQGRYRGFEVVGLHRILSADYISFENRQTLLGRLREESQLQGRLFLGKRVQAELEWDRSRSDQVLPGALVASGSGATADPDSASTGWGDESSLLATVRYLRSGLPNLVLRRGRILREAAGGRQEKWISRAELEVSLDQAGYRPLGIDRLWLRAFYQRSDWKQTGIAAEDSTDSLATQAPGKRTTHHAIVRLNGSASRPLSWNVAWEDRRTQMPTASGTRDLRRFQEVDATVHSQPHASLDAFLRWEANRDLSWHPAGGSGGFGVRRVLLGTFQAYPGRVLTILTPISFRLDLGENATEKGEPGVELPGMESFWTSPSQLSLSRKLRNRVFETRLQLLSWLRFIDRWETETDRTDREGLVTEGKRRRLENRFEIRPRGGLVILRGIGTDWEASTSQIVERRFSGQWDQTWGRGILTHVSLELHQTETQDRNVGDLVRLYNPLVQITWRRSSWRLDATVGGALTWTHTKDTSVGASGAWDVNRKQSLTASLSMSPLKTLLVKFQYWLIRTEVEADLSSPASGKTWGTDHDLRLQFQLRA